jgi:3-deoxy-7-phosphoheptulonate synthase
MNIEEIKEVVPPFELLSQYQTSLEDNEFIQYSRTSIENILVGKDNRLLVVVGPCSIHDYDSAIEYAKMLRSVKDNYPNIFLVMRVYFEKPRSRTGWKGFIYDPNLDDSFDINKGITLARKLLLEITRLKIPIGCEFLDTITPQYLSDLVTWGAIGARTSESQIHRQLASGLSMPIGFKNLTSGDYEKAIDGIISANYSHNFLGIDSQGKVAQVITKGNAYGHLILRGGTTPNYSEDCISSVTNALKKENISTGIIVDCSHGNSEKDYNRQILVALYVRRLMMMGAYPVRGIMIESNINKGKQVISASMQKGVSITDSCIDFLTTDFLFNILNSYYCMDHCDISLDTARKMISQYDSIIHSILNGTFNEKTFIHETLVCSKYCFEEDKEVAALCKGLEHEELLLMFISIRLSLSETIALIKFRNNPFTYLHKSNDFLKEITDRDVEKTIITNYKHPLYLKIMELSKNIQVKFLEKHTSQMKIGYLYGRGTFSHEAVQNFRGVHISHSSLDTLKTAHLLKSVDYILVPTYNSIIGEIFNVTGTKLGSIDHTIELNLYGNKNSKEAEFLFVEPHIQKECANYIKNLKIQKNIYTKSSVDGLHEMISYNNPCLTISSSKNESNLYYTLDKDIVKHNITTFSLI